MPKLKRQVHPDSPLPSRLAMSIPEFCEAHGFSTALFFKLQRKGLAPRTMKLGVRTLISFESAAEWRAQREGKTISG